MHNFFINNSNLPKMTAKGANSLMIVEKHICALLKDDIKGQLAILSDEITVDYSGKNGYGIMKFPKADAINFHKALRLRIEVIGFTIFLAFGDGNTVFILGDTTEKNKESGIILKENCIWIYTLELELITKIEYLKECHPLYDFFSSIIESKLKNNLNADL